MSISHTTLRTVEKPILQFLDGTQITNPRLFYKIYEGYGFAASKNFKSVNAGAGKQILFRNLAGSGRKVNIVSIEVVGLAQLYAEIYVGNTITSVGTTVTPLNLRPSTGISSVAQVAYDGTYTLGTLIYDMVCPGGSRNFAVGGALALGEAVMLDEDVNFVLKIINASASATDFSTRAIWWEESF